MNISGINFTSATSFLKKNQVKQSGSLENVSKEKTETDKIYDQSIKVRNWAVGLGSAAVLISLGVLGRNGSLGKSVQTLLGGQRNNVLEAVEAITDDVIEALKKKNANEISLKEWNQIVNHYAPKGELWDIHHSVFFIHEIDNVNHYITYAKVGSGDAQGSFMFKNGDQAKPIIDQIKSFFINKQ